MIDKSIRTDGPTISREDAYEQFAEQFRRQLGEGIDANQLTYCSWPQAFGSTAGPFRGVGGQAVTSFRMEAWECDGWAVVFCNGRVVKFCDCSVFAQWGKRDKSIG